MAKILFGYNVLYEKKKYSWKFSLKKTGWIFLIIWQKKRPQQTEPL